MKVLCTHSRIPRTRNQNVAGPIRTQGNTEYALKHTPRFKAGYAVPIQMCNIFNNLVIVIRDRNVFKTCCYKIRSIHPRRREKLRIGLYKLAAAVAADNTIILHLSPWRASVSHNQRKDCRITFCFLVTTYTHVY